MPGLLHQLDTVLQYDRSITADYPIQGAMCTKQSCKPASPQRTKVVAVRCSPVRWQRSSLLPAALCLYCTTPSRHDLIGNSNTANITAFNCREVGLHLTVIDQRLFRSTSVQRGYGPRKIQIIANDWTRTSTAVWWSSGWPIRTCRAPEYRHDGLLGANNASHNTKKGESLQEKS